MAKFRKWKLSWRPAASDQIVGYKLYWSKDNNVGYESNFLELGNVCEVLLPDIFKYFPRPGDSIYFGVAAVDKHGNESDIVLLAVPYQVKAPPAPADFALAALDDFSFVDPKQEVPKAAGSIQPGEQSVTAEQEKGQSGLGQTKANLKYYDDIGYRKLEIKK